MVGWLTPEECSPLDYTSQELEDAGASDHVRQMLGHRSYNPTLIQEGGGSHPTEKGGIGGGGGLWLRSVRRIEDYEYSSGEPRLRHIAKV